MRQNFPNVPPPRTLEECVQLLASAEGLKALACRPWRLENLYWIKDVRGREYKPLCELGGIPQYGWDLHHSLYPEDGMGVRTNNLRVRPDGKIEPRTVNVLVGKARQVGITTLSILEMLDAITFANRRMRCGICNHTESECEKTVEEKLHGVRNNSPWLIFKGLKNVSKRRVAYVRKNEKGEEDQYAIIEVMQKPRGQNPDMGLITEYGIVSVEDQQKAKEMRDSWFAATEYTPLIIESTSFGPSGHYYELCEIARELQVTNRELDSKSFDFHFIGWQDKPINVLDYCPFAELPEHSEYFADVEEETGRALTQEQKNWWLSTLMNQFSGDMTSMKHEHAGTYTDFFSTDNEAYVMAKEMRLMENEKRCTIDLARNPKIGCVVAFDLGKTDDTAFVAAQLDEGGFVRIIDSYKARNEDMQHFLERIRQAPYTVNCFVLPWDAGNKGAVAKHLTGGKDITVEQMFRDMGINNIYISHKMEQRDGMLLARNFSKMVKIDVNQKPLIRDLRSVRKEYNKAAGEYIMKLIDHRPYNHFYSAFRHLAQAHSESPGVFDPDYESRTFVGASSEGGVGEIETGVFDDDIGSIGVNA